MTKKEFIEALEVADVTQDDWFDDLVEKVMDLELRGFMRGISHGHNNNDGDYGEMFREDVIELVKC